LAKGHGKDHSEGKSLGHDKASGHPGKSSGKGKGGKGISRITFALFYTLSTKTII